MSTRTPLKTMTRRDFTLESALVLLGGCIISVSDACSSSSPSPSPTPAPADINGSISNNHSHSALLMGGQITAGTAFLMSIQGTAVHPHTVSLTQADLQTLKNRQSVTKDSSTDLSGVFGLHNHTVTFTPA